MSAQNDDIVGGQQSPAIAYALGNIDDTSLPVHLRLRVPVRATKPKHKEENPKFNCPRRECKEGFRSKDELEKHQWKRCHYRCIECELDFHDAEAQFAHNSKASPQSPLSVIDSLSFGQRSSSVLSFIACLPTHTRHASQHTHTPHSGPTTTTLTKHQHFRLTNNPKISLVLAVVQSVIRPAN